MTLSRTLSQLQEHYLYILVDSNALIFHPSDEDDRRLLNNRQGSLEQRRALVLKYKSPILDFYRTWLDSFECDPPRFFVTAAQLDLELSAWRFINRDPLPYRKRFKTQDLPKGDLVNDHDIKDTRKAKNRLLATLQRRTINRIVRKKARALRKQLEEQFLARPIWKRYLSVEGISLIDRDLLVNGLALATAGKTAVISNDKALRRVFRNMRRNLSNPSWAGEGPHQKAAEKLAGMKLELCMQRDIAQPFVYELEP